MFSAYMQEVNLKVFNLFYSRFCYGPDICTGNFSFKIWRGSVKNTILLHTHTHHTFSKLH